MEAPPPINNSPAQPVFDLAAKKKLQKSALIKILGGYAACFVAYIPLLAEEPDPALAVIAVILILGCAVAIYWGWCDYARSKGYHWALGFIAFFGCIGIIIMLALPDKLKPAVSAPQWPTNYPRHPDA